MSSQLPCTLTNTIKILSAPKYYINLNSIQEMCTYICITIVNTVLAWMGLVSLQISHNVLKPQNTCILRHQYSILYNAGLFYSRIMLFSAGLNQVHTHILKHVPYKRLYYYMVISQMPQTICTHNPVSLYVYIVGAEDIFQIKINLLLKISQAFMVPANVLKK